MDDRTLSVAGMIARIAALELALEPFAQAGRAYRHRVPATRLLSTATGDVTVEHLVRAVNTLEGEPV